MSGRNQWRPTVAEQTLILLLRGAAPGDAGRVHRRLGGTTMLQVLERAEFPAHVRQRLAADPDAQVRRALARNPGLSGADLAVLAAGPRDPVVDARVFAHPAAGPAVRRAVLAAGRYDVPAGRSRTPDAVHALVLEAKDAGVAAAGVVADVPEVVGHALRTGGPELAEADQLRAALQLLDHGGRAALASAVNATEGLRPDVASRARAAAAGGDAERAALATAVAAAEGTQGLIAELMEGRCDALARREPVLAAGPAPAGAAGEGARGTTSRRDTGVTCSAAGIDWAALAAAHDERPFPRAGAVQLAAHPACPPEFVRALFARHPAAVAAVAPGDRELVRQALSTPRQPGLTKVVAAAARAGVPTAEDTELVATTAAPASTALALLADLPPSGVVRDLLHRHLGSDARRWAAARAALDTFKGTLPELLAAAAGAGAPAGATPATLTRAFRVMLLTARQDDLAAVLPGLPDVVVRDLLTSGTLPAHVVDAAIGSADPRAWAAVGANARLDARALARVVARNDPAANAAVYRNPRATPSLRRAIVAGRPLPGGRGRTAPAPLDPDLRAELLVRGERRDLCPLIVSSDPELALRAIKFGIRMVAQRYILRQMWQYHGRAAAEAFFERALASVGEAVRRVFRRALAAEDDAAALTVLAEGAEAYDDPATLPRLLAGTRGTSSIRDLLNEPYAHDWKAIVAAHRKSPFMPEAAEELARHEDASDEERALFRLVVVNDARPSPVRNGDLRLPAELLREHPLDRDCGNWLTAAVREGFVTGREVLENARGTGHLVSWLTSPADGPVAADDLWSALDAEVAGSLAGHPEAWAVALQLAPDFAGTLPELLALAAQIAGPAPSPAELAAADAAAAARGSSWEPAADTAGQASDETSEGTGPTAPISARLRPRLAGTAAPAAIEALFAWASGERPAPPDDVDVLTHLASVPAADMPGGVLPAWLAEAVLACPADDPRAALALTSRDGRLVEDLVDAGGDEVREAASRNHRLSPQLRQRLWALASGSVSPRLTAPGWTPQAPRTGAELIARARLSLERKDYHIPADVRRGLLDGRVTTAELVGLVAVGRAPESTWLFRHDPGRAAEARRAMLRTALGTDPARWLHVMTAARRTGDTPLREVIASVGAGPVPGPLPALRDLEETLPRTPRELEAALEGRNRPVFPGGHILRDAPPPTQLAVLDALGPDADWLYVALCRDLPAEVTGHLATHGDPVTLRGMARAAQNVPAPVVRTMLERGCDDTVLALFVHGDDDVRRAVLARSPVAPGVREQILSPACPTGILELCLDAADPALAEHAASRLRRRLGVLDQLRVCATLLRHGGPDRLRDFITAGGAGPSVAALVSKALDKGDAVAVIDRRIRRETTTPRLAGRLLREGPRSYAALLLRPPHEPDFAAFAAQHREEPLPLWVLELLAAHPSAPPEIADAAVDLANVTRAVELVREHPSAAPGFARSGLRGPAGPIAGVLDECLARGKLTGYQLIHEARPAGEVLRYLLDALRRPELPDAARAQAAAARDEAVRLMSGLGARGWARAYRGLCGLVPGEEDDTVAALLTRAAAM